MPQKRMECFRLLFDHLAWIEHQFLNSIRDSRKPGSQWGMIRGVGGVRKSIDQSWLAKGLGLGLLCWGFKGVQEEIPREEASTLQIGSGAFPPRQCVIYIYILDTYRRNDNRRKNKGRRKTSLTIFYLSFYCKVSKGLFKGCMWEDAGDRT